MRAGWQEDQGERAVSLMWNPSRKQFSAKNLSSGCCGYEDGPGGCGLFSLTVGVYEDTMEVVCMRSEREKLHFMDFKQRIPVAAPSLNVSSGCEEMGEQENTEITKFKKLKTTKNKSTKVTETKKTHYLRQDLVKRLCLANVALSFKLQPESEMGLSRSSNPQASDEAWFPHKSCHDIHYSASHRASLPRPPVHFRWTTLRLRATRCKCYTSKEREPEEGFEKHIRTDSPQSTVSTPA